MSTEICNNVRFTSREMQIIGEKIRNIRQSVDNCTQAEFAAKYGVSARLISDIESGTHAPSAEFLYQLRKNKHNLNDLLAPIDAQGGSKAAKFVLPTEAEFLTKLFANAFKLPITTKDIEILAGYCASSPIAKMIIQATIESDKEINKR